jgi:hypothetical protein
MMLTKHVHIGSQWERPIEDDETQERERRRRALAAAVDHDFLLDQQRIPYRVRLVHASCIFMIRGVVNDKGCFVSAQTYCDAAAVSLSTSDEKTTKALQYVKYVGH